MRFEEFAGSYETHAAPQRAFARRVAEFAAIRAEEKVLEFGAGTGALTRYLCEKAGARVHATDLSPAMVTIGKAAVPTAQWSVLDAFGRAVPASDVQISSGLLQWAPAPLQALRSWASALTKGGRMVHAFPCEPCLREWRQTTHESPIVWRDASGWKSLFESAGLRVLRHSLWIEDHTFDSALEMLRSMHRSGVTGKARLTPGRLRQCLRAYDQQHRVAGGVRITWAWLAIEATCHYPAFRADNSSQRL